MTECCISDPQTGILRGLILGRLCKCGHMPTVAKAVAKFYDRVEKGVPLVADLRSTVFSTVGRTEGRRGIYALKKVFETCGFSEVERQCVVALGQTTEPELLEEVRWPSHDEVLPEVGRIKVRLTQHTRSGQANETQI